MRSSIREKFLTRPIKYIYCELSLLLLKTIQDRFIKRLHFKLFVKSKPFVRLDGQKVRKTA